MESRMEAAEVLIAHLTRTVEDLSDVVARQATEIALLTRRVEMLMQHEAEREADGAALIGDQQPPHY